MLPKRRMQHVSCATEDWSGRKAVIRSTYTIDGRRSPDRLPPRPACLHAPARVRETAGRRATRERGQKLLQQDKDATKVGERPQARRDTQQRYRYIDSRARAAAEAGQTKGNCEEEQVAALFA